MPYTETFRVAVPRLPSAQGMRRLGLFALQQVKQRFATHGASGGTPWRQKRVKEWGADDGHAVLTGDSATLLNGWGYRIEGNRIILENAAPHAHVQQVGTAKYGGPIPTIRPIHAKALFIPITRRARLSARVHGWSGGGGAAIMRIATRGKKLKTGEFAPLKKGRLHEGRLQVQDRDGEWVDGTPDFIFLKKVDIPPRPMLPNSPAEQAEQRRMVTDVLIPLAAQSPQQQRRTA
jgi:hypothetical protein